MHESRTTRIIKRWACRLLVAIVCVLIWCWLWVFATQAQPLAPTRRVNIPFFDDQVQFSEMAIFWFGQVDNLNNYVDVRVGYNNEYLRIRTAAFDRRLWYDTDPAAPDLTEWDAVTLYLDLSHDGGDAPAADDYHFVAQLNWWETRDDYQAVYRGNGSGWVTVTLPFTTTSGWRGNAPNDDIDDRGWVMDFYIPFDSLGLSVPAAGTVWGMAVTLHDRDDAAGTPIAVKVWPETMDLQRPNTWGQLRFGMPAYTHQPVAPGDVVTVRQGLNGASVVDGHVGGHSNCGDPFGPNYFDGWGDANYTGYGQINIQNQGDLADWPCYSKYYVTFPLDAIPADKVVVSATLTLHQFGSAGGAGQAQPSLIQVFTVGEDWNEATLTWNNAPLAMENVSATWVDPLSSFPGWPGVPYTWDLSKAVTEAYAARTPLRLALYEADGAYHSGKYFVSSDTDDWNAEGRPTLRVLWGDPAGGVDKTASSSTAMPGETLTYTLAVVGSGQALTLTDELPAGVSPPLAYSSGLAYTPHRLAWTGSPSLGQQVTLTYVVTITAPARVALSNQVVLTQTSGVTGTATAWVLVDPLRVYLPLVLKSG